MSLDDSVSGHHTGTYGQPPPHAAFASKGSPSDNDSLVHVVITPSPASSPKPLKVQLTPATSATSGGGVGGKAAAGGEQAGLASPRKPHDLDAAITKSPKLGKEQQYEAISPSAEDQPAEQLRPATQSYAAKVRVEHQCKDNQCVLIQDLLLTKHHRGCLTVCACCTTCTLLQDKEAHQTEQAASGAHHHAPNPASAPRGLLARLVTSLGVPLTLLGTLLVVVAATHLIVHVRSRQAHITSGSSQSRASGGDTVAPTSPQHGGGRGRAQAVY
jgi:hypothetical protein